MVQAHFLRGLILTRKSFNEKIALETSLPATGSGLLAFDSRSWQPVPEPATTLYRNVAVLIPFRVCGCFHAPRSELSGWVTDCDLLAPEPKIFPTEKVFQLLS